MRKNKSHRAVPSRKDDGSASATSILSSDSRSFRKYVAALCLEQGLPRRIDYGRWGIEILAYWPRQRHLDLDFPHGDVDAPITPVLDALGRCLLDDDVRIRPLAADGEYTPNNPRIEVTFKRWE